MARPRKNPDQPAKTASESGHGELLKVLWNAAVALRGTIEPSDYKKYVLPLLFLRHLSLRYEQRKAQLEAMVADPANADYFGLDGVVDDPQEYKSVGALLLPSTARWKAVNALAVDPKAMTKLDELLAGMTKDYPELDGLFPPTYAGSNLQREELAKLIDLFSNPVFSADSGGLDVLGRVYEYFIGEFASSEGKRGGEYFTPLSIVRTLVALLEPRRGKVLDPCCGSGGMFVQSDVFAEHSGQLAFYGHESKEFTQRLCRMNLFVHGLEGKVELGNSYFGDKFAGEQFDFVLANPPFNDGSKSDDGWGAGRVKDDDARRKLDGKVMPLSPRNANTLWMLHFLSHLKDGGTAGFVMATGELSSSEVNRLAVRTALVEGGFVDCIVQLSGQLFANTQIPCALWVLSKGKDGRHGTRERRDEVLFLDGRKLGALMPGSRKQRELAAEEIERMAAMYRQFKAVGAGVVEAVPGFCKVATREEIRGHRFALAPGRYVGSAAGEEDDEAFEERFPRLVAELRGQLAEAEELARRVLGGLSGVDFA